jgi:hypothetical protein
MALPSSFTAIRLMEQPSAEAYGPRQEKAVVCALAVRGLPVVVVNPRQVRDFARSKGILANQVARKFPHDHLHSSGSAELAERAVTAYHAPDFLDPFFPQGTLQAKHFIMKIELALP